MKSSANATTPTGSPTMDHGDHWICGSSPNVSRNFHSYEFGSGELIKGKQIGKPRCVCVYIYIYTYVGVKTVIFCRLYIP